jgi:hypothetical protein
MEFLGGLPEIGAKPAIHLYRCRRCNHVASDEVRRRS